MLSRSSWADAYYYDDPEAKAAKFDLDAAVEDVVGHFDKKARLHNSTERVYRLPDIGAFAAYFPESNDLATGLSIELYDKSYRRGFLNKIKWDLTVAEQRLGLAAGWKFIPIIDLTIQIHYTRDFDRNEYTWGLGFGLVKF